MKHILDIENQKSDLHGIFETMRSGNAILFLGAGASVGEKRFLSKEVIEYYEDYLGRNYQETNVTKFVDMLSAEVKFNRSHFDSEVEKMLRKLKPSDGHKILTSIPWREIITTNYDLLVEMAYDEVNSTNPLKLIPIRGLSKSSYRPANDEIKYVKLNGCISDKRSFPLAFSTDDFRKCGPLYKNVLHELKNISPSIQFISIGYSFKDEFGKQLLEKFDSYNYREKKWLINIDPFPNENALEYYTQNRVQIIKCSFDDFFKEYNKWNDENIEHTLKRRSVTFTTSRDSQITIPSNLSINLNGVIKQLNNHVKEKPISEREYFKGEEPNYRVILRGIDVVRTVQNENIVNKILSIVTQNETNFVPIIFITGEFGIGKSTFSFRLIHEMNKDENLDLVAFEILDFVKLKKEYLVELFSYCRAKNIVLFCDEIEIDSAFKSLLELRRELSIEQFNDFNLFFLAPIRENILRKHAMQRDVKQVHEIAIEGKLSDTEINELLDKLKLAGLINFRSVQEKNEILRKVKKEFGGDSFVSLMEIVTDGHHINDLIGAYNELSNEAKEAFKFTALMHRHKLFIPAAWLKLVISLDWTEFIERVVKVEGKGILIQEDKFSNGTEPDLYFRTKHPLIAERLIEKIVPIKEKQFKLYERILNTVAIGQTNSLIVTNLLKAIKTDETFTSTKIQLLYDIAYSKLSDDPYFLLNYAINLQSRKTKENLEKAVEVVIYAEGLLDKRNHKFLHRRAVINFDLAKLAFQQEEQLNYTLTYLKEAKDLFVIKQVLDPFSSYSYYDYIKLLIWEASKLNHDEETQLQLRIQIQELFDIADRTITEGFTRINSLKQQYGEYLRNAINAVDYFEYLQGLYSDFGLRPYACILLHSHYESLGNSEKCVELVEEMKQYLYNNEIIKFLFKIFGRMLHNNNSRMFFFKLTRDYPFLEESQPLRYRFYNFVAESYSHHYAYALEHLNQIETRYNGMNPEFHFVWKDDDGEEVIFEGRIIKEDGKKYKAIKVSSLQRTFRLIKGDYSTLNVGTTVKLKLHFYINGIRAVILEVES